MLMAALGLLLLIGLVSLASASAPVGFERFNDKYFFLKRQVLFGIIPGIVAFLGAWALDYKWLRKFYWLWYVATVAMIAMVYIPGFGIVINGSRSWIEIAGYALQPSEFAKITFVIFVALWCDSRGRLGATRFWQDIGMFMALLALPVVLLMRQPDTGTMGIFIGIGFTMLIVARARLLHLSVLVLAAGVLLAALVAAAPYRAERVMTFLHPELDPQGVGYHINQAFLAIGSGGWWGLGYGNSRQKFQYLPEVSADSIFAVMAEEYGFFLSTLFLGLLLVIFLRGLAVAKNASDQFGMYLATGIIAWFGVQTFLNIGAMLGLLPLTGVPLPFVSHGGSALLVGMAAIGLLVTISRQTRSVT